ncbi:MAG: monofunctional biosynthetic peptidoglycan transglycosylase [Burkholderiales bacterium]|nr:monofunctional biosynthetic peptidoglycan transglycosylase [Burkholderiales bacterium]
MTLHLRRHPFWQAGLRWLILLILCALGLQVYFLGRIFLMRYTDPASTAFQRSEVWRISHKKHDLRWSQRWVSFDKFPTQIQRAVIASEDDTFATHTGVQWAALERAWSKNSRAQARAQARNQTPKVVGGSTITQQLAKNLFLSGERTLFRKTQELILTLALEQFLSKQRILDIYLNSVEWGEGVFGVEAASNHYFKQPAAQLNAWQAARLAVMLPRPKYYEKLSRSPYLNERASVILTRMSMVALP